jgi:hypothetical protein
MHKRRNTSHTVFWLTVVLSAVLVIYPLSWGPWCFCCGATEPLWRSGPPADLTARGFYIPVAYVMKRMPGAIDNVYLGYLGWWHAQGVHYQMWNPHPAP